MKRFFKSLGKDIGDSFKKHWLALIGYIISIILPLIIIISQYLTKEPNKWSLPCFVWIPLAVLLIVYWFKLRTFLAVKVNDMKRENRLEKGKYAGFIILCKVLQLLMTIAPFVLCYFIFKELTSISVKIENIFLLLTICESAGGLFILVDTIRNLNFEESKDEEI